MAQADNLATIRLEMASKGVELKPLPKEIDPALRIPSSRRIDAWTNLTTGFGTKDQHAVANSLFDGIDKLDSSQLEELYQSDWVARKGVDAPAEDMVRNGISYVHNDDDSEEGESQEENQKKVEDFDKLLVEKYKMWPMAFSAFALAGMSGGSITVFNFDDISSIDEFKDPLNENQVSEIRWIKSVPAFQAIPVTYYQDINHPKWGLPEHYQVVMREPSFGVTIICHESRIIRVDGRFTTPNKRVANRGYNDSDIQAVYTALRDYGVCVTSSNSTMENFVQDYLGLKGLAEKVMMGEDNYVLDRIALTHSQLTSSKLNIYDAESESMERKGTPITGLANLWNGYTEAICGAWGIPRSRFFSTETGQLGGNAAESDTRNYFNRIHSRQEITARPFINSFMSFVNLGEKLLTELPDYTFNELQEQSDKEKADTAYTVAQRDQIYLQENVVSPEEVTRSRFSKAQPDLETMNVDFEAREEMDEDEATTEEVEEMRNTIAEMELNNAISEEAARQNFQPRPIPSDLEKTAEEKRDALTPTVHVTPEIKITQPPVNVNFKDPEDHTEELADLKKTIEDLNEKLNQDIGFED